MKKDYGISKFSQPLTAPSFTGTEDVTARKIRGYVPIAAPAWLSTSSATGTTTISIGSVVGTNSVAVRVAVRCQDTYSLSYAEAVPKVAVESTQLSKVRVHGKVAGGLGYAQGVIPVNTSREFLFTKNQAVQTASVAVVGYFI